MKFSLKRNSKRYLILGFVLASMLFGMVVNSVAFAISKPTVVLFYTDWNLQCRDAKPTLETIVGSYSGRVDLQELNIDLSPTPDKARSYGLSIPTRVPYVVILDRNGKIVYQRAYNAGNVQQLRSDVENTVAPLL